MKKIIYLLLLIGLQLHALPSNEAKNSLVIYGIRGPSGLGMIRLFEEPPAVPGFNVRVEALAQADLLAARFIAGDAKIGILPPNMAAKIASSGKNIKAAAVVGMGMLSLLTFDPQIVRIGDLAGKTVEAAGQGASPDYVFRRILLHHGLTPDVDVKLGFSLAYPEIAQSLIAGRISTALLPEPFASMALAGRPDLRQITDIQNEWRLITGGDNFPMTVLAVDGDFADSNPEALRIIMSELEKSINWTIGHPVEAGSLSEKHGLGFPPGAAAAAVPKSNYVFIPALAARSSLENLYRVFLEFSPVSIGGRLPADDFYLK